MFPGGRGKDGERMEKYKRRKAEVKRSLSADGRKESVGTLQHLPLYTGEMDVNFSPSALQLCIAQ